MILLVGKFRFLLKVVKTLQRMQSNFLFSTQLVQVSAGTPSSVFDWLTPWWARVAPPGGTGQLTCCSQSADDEVILMTLISSAPGELYKPSQHSPRVHPTPRDLTSLLPFNRFSINLVFSCMLACIVVVNGWALDP